MCIYTNEVEARAEHEYNDEEKAVDFCELGQSDFVAALCSARCGGCLLLNTPQVITILFRYEGFSPVVINIVGFDSFLLNLFLVHMRAAWWHQIVQRIVIANLRTNELRMANSNKFAISFHVFFYLKRSKAAAADDDVAVSSSTKFAPSFHLVSVFHHFYTQKREWGTRYDSIVSHLSFFLNIVNVLRPFHRKCACVLV